MNKLELKLEILAQQKRELQEKVNRLSSQIENISNKQSRLIEQIQREERRRLKTENSSLTKSNSFS